MFKFHNVIKGVNDTAEHGVNLIEDYNEFTKNEGQKQFILQVTKQLIIYY